MTEDVSSTEPQLATSPYPRRWPAAIVLIAAFLMDLMSITSVTLALPTIQRELGAHPVELEWISAAYLLAFAVGLITAARLGDLCGRKRVFLISVAAFGLASLCCGLAPTVPVLIAARTLQGLGAAGIAPQVLSTVYSIFDGKERATVFGVWGIVASLAQAIGVLLGGVLITADLAGSGWRAVFVVNVPLAAALIVLGARLVPETRFPGAARPNVLAAGVLTAGLVAVIVPLLEAPRLGWSAWWVACLLAGVLAIIGLTVGEARARRPGALLPADLLKIRAVGSALLIQLVAFGGFSGLLLVLSLWMQNGLGFSPLRAGVVTVAFSAGALLTAPYVGRLTVRFGRLTIVAGCVVFAVGSLALLPAGYATPDADVWSLVPGLLLLGAGLNLIMPTLTTLFMAAVPPHHAASASGIVSTGQQFAGALGVAALGSLFFAVLSAGDHRGAFTTSAWVVAALLVGCAALSFTMPGRAGPTPR